MAWTVQKLIDDRMTLHASCNACHHNRQLDLSVLRERLGPDAPAMAGDLIPRLRWLRRPRRVADIFAEHDAER